MKHLLHITTLAFILCSCSNVGMSNSTTNDAVKTITATPAATIAPTETPIEISSITPPPVFFGPHVIETPFWESYIKATPVPIIKTEPASNQADYIEVDRNTGRGAKIWMRPFKTDFEAAVSNNQDWIKYPERIALRISGYPNPDSALPEEVLLFQPSEDKVTAIVSDLKLLDDSLFGIQYRVEMSKIGSYWSVTWLGMRWQCRSNRGHEDWGITPCN